MEVHRLCIKLYVYYVMMATPYVVKALIWKYIVSVLRSTYTYGMMTTPYVVKALIWKYIISVLSATYTMG